MVSWFRRSAEGDKPAVVHGTLEMHDPRVRPSSHPVRSADAGAFLSITNRGDENDRLVAASSPLAESAEIHGIKVVDADIQMQPLANGRAVRAGDTTVLKPRGYHLLLRGLKGPLPRGSTLPVTLTFEKAGAATVDFVVEEPGLIGEAILNLVHHRG